ncbi:unnamed protein product [Mucor hiemalis]
MQPWIEKASGSGSSKSSTLHYDRTLSHLHHYNPSQQQSTSSSSSGFRTLQQADKNATSQHQYQALEQPNTFQSNFDFSPIQHTNGQIFSYTDGGDVMNFLNSTEYSDHVHGDDLRPDSMSYISHRHQFDTQHGLSEKEKLNHQWTTELMAAEDIVDYLMTTNYTEDIYGIPIIGQWIKEAKKEIELDKTSENSKKAIARLSMIRNHLVNKASGNSDLAAQNALRMNESDWSLAFFESSS